MDDLRILLISKKRKREFVNLWFKNGSQRTLIINYLHFFELDKLKTLYPSDLLVVDLDRVDPEDS